MIPRPTRHFTLLALATALLAGCAEKKTPGYQGYVEGEFVYVSSSESGRLDRLLVSRGQNVAAKTPLFVLEAKNEAAAERQAREQVNAAEAALRDMRSGKRSQEIEVIRAQLAQAVAREKTSAADLARNAALYKNGVVSQAQLDVIEAEAETNAARVRELKGQLEVARLAARDEQVRLQSANVAAARAALEQASWRLGEKAVIASVSGRVFDTMYREGEWVQAGKPVVRLLPPGNVKVRFFVPETLLGALSIGKEVVISCDGCKADIPAKITFVATEAEYTPPIIYSNDTRAKLVFMIEAHPLSGKEPNLHPGQPVEVRLK